MGPGRGGNDDCRRGRGWGRGWCWCGYGGGSGCGCGCGCGCGVWGVGDERRSAALRRGIAAGAVVGCWLPVGGSLVGDRPHIVFLPHSVSSPGCQWRAPCRRVTNASCHASFCLESGSLTRLFCSAHATITHHVMPHSVLNPGPTPPSSFPVYLIPLVSLSKPQPSAAIISPPPPPPSPSPPPCFN